VFSGDNDMASESLRDIASRIGQADLIVSYNGRDEAPDVVEKIPFAFVCHYFEHSVRIASQVL